MKRLSTIDRFMRHVEKQPNGCWKWTAALNHKGYGHFTWLGVGPMAHRCSWALIRGEIPRGFHIDHLCRNRACVNPDHLEAVTPKENIRRGNTGENHRQKTHCPKGHEYAGENLYIDRKGGRICRTCNRAACATWKAKHKGELRVTPV